MDLSEALTKSMPGAQPPQTINKFEYAYLSDRSEGLLKRRPWPESITSSRGKIESGNVVLYRVLIIILEAKIRIDHFAPYFYDYIDPGL